MKNIFSYYFLPLLLNQFELQINILHKLELLKLMKEQYTNQYIQPILEIHNFYISPVHIQ